MTILISAILIVFLFVLLHRYLLVQRQEEENSMIALHLETEQAYYSALSRQAEAIRQYRHDLAGHIRTLEYLMEHEDQEELLPYLQQLQTQHKSVSLTVFSNNEVVNALLNGYMERCAQKGIVFSVDISGEMTGERKIIDTSFFSDSFSSDPEEEGTAIRITDFCALLNNLLENAVEECDRIAASPKEAQKERQILLSVVQTISEIRLSVTNTIRSNNPLTFKTGKQHPELHGIGNVIIHRIAEGCGGTVTDTVTPSASLCRTVTLPIAG